MNYRLLYIIPQGAGQVSNQTEKRNESLHGPKYYFSSWWLSQFFFSLKYDSTKVYPTLFILSDNWTKHLCLVINLKGNWTMTFCQEILSGLQATKSNWTTAFVHEWHVDWLSSCHTMMLTTSLMCELALPNACMGRLHFVCTSLKSTYTLLVLVLYHNT